MTDPIASQPLFGAASSASQEALLSAENNPAGRICGKKSACAAAVGVCCSALDGAGADTGLLVAKVRAMVSLAKAKALFVTGSGKLLSSARPTCEVLVATLTAREIGCGCRHSTSASCKKKTKNPDSLQQDISCQLSVRHHQLSVNSYHP